MKFVPKFAKNTMASDLRNRRFPENIKDIKTLDDYKLGIAYIETIFKELIFQGLSPSSIIKLIASHPPLRFKEVEDYDLYLTRISSYLLGKNHISV